MKTPTKKELQQLAVEALGEGATVQIEEFQWETPPWQAMAEGHTAAHFENRETEKAAKIALAAALRALAEVRK